MAPFRRFLVYALFDCLLLAPLTTRAQSSNDYSRAEALVRHGRWNEGIEILEPLLASQPHHLKALNLLGIAFTGQGNLEATNREFKRALEIDPEFVPALQNLAINEFGLHDVDAAERHLEIALKLAPENPVVQAYLGEIAYGKGDFEGAAGHLAKAGVMRQEPAVAARLIVSDLETGRKQDAISLLRR